MDDALCRRNPRPWLDGEREAAKACLHCPVIAACRTYTRRMIERAGPPFAVAQAGVKWPASHLSRPEALTLLHGASE